MAKAIALFFCFASLAWADISIPELSSPVMDEAHLLSEPDREALRALLLRLEASGKVQMAVLITPSLQDHDIESYSIRVAEKWKLGKKGTDQGLLLVIAPQERRMRLEIGYGLEGDIPDAVAKQLLADRLAPYFREARYGEGIMVVVADIGQRLGVALDAPVRPLKRRSSGGLPAWLWILFVLMVIPFALLNSGSRGYRRRGWSSGGWGGGGWGGGGGGGWSSGGGGGFSGGGGGFGGGGSSSSW